MKIPLRLALALLPILLLAGCNLFNGPSMDVVYRTTTIQNGGSVTLSTSAGIDQTFTAQNTGFSTIDFTGSPKHVEVSGSTGSWTVRTDLPASLGGGDSADFVIGTSGSGSATVRIPNNKGADFTFKVGY